MNREEFARLPLSQALGVLYDANVKGYSLESIVAPEPPRPARMPQYDQRMSTRGGYCWASECDMSQLQYYLSRALKPSTDPKYTIKNERDAKAIAYFIAWREQNPNAIWTGERYGLGVVDAASPSSRPRVTEWEPRAEEPKSEPLRSNYPSDDDDSFLFGAGK